MLNVNLDFVNHCLNVAHKDDPFLSKSTQNLDEVVALDRIGLNSPCQVGSIFNNRASSFKAIFGSSGTPVNMLPDCLHPVLSDFAPFFLACS